MSQLPSADPRTALQDARLAPALARFRDALVTPVEAAFFWAAVVLPFLHVPLLLTGLGTTAEQLAFGTLLALNLIAIVVGHDYRRS